MKHLLALLLSTTFIFVTGCVSSSGSKNANPVVTDSGGKLKKAPFIVTENYHEPESVDKTTYRYRSGRLHTNINFGYSGEEKDKIFITAFPPSVGLANKASDHLMRSAIIKGLNIDKNTLFNIILAIAEFSCSDVNVSGNEIWIVKPQIEIDLLDIAQYVQSHSNAWLSELNRSSGKAIKAWINIVDYVKGAYVEKSEARAELVKKQIETIAAFRYIQKSYKEKAAYASYDTWRAAGLNPDEAFIQLRHAEASYRRMDYENGQAAFSKAHEQMGSPAPEALLIQGLADLIHGGPDEAMTRFKKALALDPDFANTYFMLAVTETMKGNKVKALLNIGKANRLQPSLFVPEMVPAIEAAVCKAGDLEKSLTKIKRLGAMLSIDKNKSLSEMKHVAAETHCDQGETLITKNRTIDVYGEMKYEISDFETSENARTLAAYAQKTELADQVAVKLINEYGVKGAREEVAAAIMTSQKFTVGDAALLGGALAVPVVLTVNADEVGRIIANLSKEYNAAVCKWHRALRYYYDQAMACKKKGNRVKDYDRAIKKILAMNQYHKYLAGTGPERSAHLDRAEANDPENEIIQIRLIESNARLGAMEKAAEHQAKALAANPGLVEAFILEANAYFRGGSFQKAGAALYRALEIDPTSPIANYMLASVYIKKGDTANGRKYMQLGAKYNNIDIKPGKGSYNIPDDVFGGSGNSMEGLAEIQAVIINILSPGRAQGVADPNAAPKEAVSRAVSVRKDGNPQKAIRELETLMRAYPEDMGIRLELGQCYFELRKYNKAISFFKQALDAGYFAAPYWLGRSYDELDQDKEAVDHYTRYEYSGKWGENAKKNIPKTVATGYFNVAYIMWKYKNYKKGTYWAQKGLGLTKRSFGYLMLGYNLYYQKKYKEALHAYEKGLKLEPDNELLIEGRKKSRRKSKTFGLF